ncbi:MAG: V-type ATP synthase subunit F [Oscillospiraceae bacterium]|nr:V-type ATP synthase subunit F [Oscillospiraceae bacterium]
MKYFCIADNNDTLTGLRMAGIEGIVAHTHKEVGAAIEGCVHNPEIGVLLITERLAALAPDLMDSLKQNSTGHTLVVEIPDRHGTGRTPDSITRYIRESIGINV